MEKEKTIRAQMVEEKNVRIQLRKTRLSGYWWRK